jgi:hypothetical protein
MRRAFVISFVLMLASLVFAGGQDDAVKKMSGYVIDNACASRTDKAKLSERVKNHPTSCALMPSCVKSGYAVLVDDKLYKLDDAGNKMVVDLFNQTKRDKGLPVAVEGTIEGETLRVKKISEAAE